MTSPNVPAGPGPRPVPPSAGPGPTGGGSPPVQPSPHGVGYTAQVPPPSQPTPPPPYGPGPGPVHGPGGHPGPPGPPIGQPGSAPLSGPPPGPYSAGSAQPHASAQPHPQPSAQPGPPLGSGGVAARAGAAATLADLGVSRRSDPALVRSVYPLAVGAGVVVWLGPVITMFALAVTFGGGALVGAAVLTLILGWIPALALIAIARLTCETWLRGEGRG